jgi:hypothetical protein
MLLKSSYSLNKKQKEKIQLPPRTQTKIEPNSNKEFKNRKMNVKETIYKTYQL